MSIHKYSCQIFLCFALLAAASAAAADDMQNGKMMMMIAPNGKSEMMPMPDKAMLDQMMKNAVEMKDDMIILVWGAKTYMIKNEKMPDGKMMFDAWGAHFTK